MKRLTISRISAASIRANRKTYLSLAAGIVLSVVLATIMTLGAYGIVKAREQKVIQTVGYTDCLLLDEPDITDESLRQSGLFDKIGKQFVIASVEDSIVYLGYTDEAGQDILRRSCVEGRMPERPGEIAVERSALEKLRLEAEVGDAVTWTLLPVDGAPEEHSFTIVGLLKEQSSALDVSSYARPSGGVLAWPAAVISPEEAFDTGRVAAHRAMTYAGLSNYTRVEKRYPDAAFFGVSRTQAMAYPTDPAQIDIAAYTQLTGMLFILGLALLLAVCVGISSAMEGVLASKTEEIGMLRAVGATRRQIRRIFGRDAWLLSLIALPVGLLIGVLAAWFLCRLSPGEMVFAPRVGLILPVAAISALCIAVASGLPLRRASRQMPMGVLRDTALLRKAGKIHSKQSFRATELIAARQLRIHPWRQLGAALMVMATLICTAFVGEMSYDAVSELTRSRPTAFSLMPEGLYTVVYDSLAFAVKKPDIRLSQQDIAQIRDLPLVEQASLEAQTSVNLLLDGDLPEYFQSMAGTAGHGSDGETTWIYNIFGGGSGMNYLALTDDDPEPPEPPEDDAAAWQRRNAWEKYREMRAVMQAQGLEGKPVSIALYVTDLSRMDLTDRIADGKVDLAAIDAGQELLVYAPTYYVSKMDDGTLLASTYAWKGRETLAEIHNDYFCAGQSLALTQLLYDGPGGDNYDAWLSDYAGMERRDAAVTVGAVLDGRPATDGTLCLLTTEAGARALGFDMTEITGMEISLTRDVDQETEKALEARLERIAMRGDMTVYNWLQSWREEIASMKQAFALFAAMLLLFFAVAAAMQVGNAGRRIRADARMIGTLRAVGADEKALLGCYRLPMVLTTAIGSLLGIGAYLLFVFWYRAQTDQWLHPLTVAPVMLVLGALCALCCVAGTRVRLKAVLNRSIVENIREL